VGTHRHGQFGNVHGSSLWGYTTTAAFHVEVQYENFSPFMDEIWVAKLSKNRH
jgi:hypothetical protein